MSCLAKGAVILCLIIVLLLFSGCARRDDLLRLGVITPSTNHLPFLLAREDGLISEDNLKVHHFSSGWEANEALLSGRIDLAIMPFTYVWQGIAEGRELKILSFLERESDGIVSRREIRTVEELDGKKVGVLRASTLDVLFHLVSDEFDIEPEIVYFRTPTEMAVALSNGHVDALSFYVPAIFQFDERFHHLLWYSELYPHHPCCDLIVSKAALERKEGEIKAFLEAMKQSCSILNEDRERGVSLIGRHFGYDEDIAGKSLRQQKFLPGLEREGREFQERVAARMYELGYLRNPVSPEEVFYDLTETD